MSLSVRPDLHDFSAPPLAKLFDGPLQSSSRSTGDTRLERNFMVSPIGNDKDKLSADFHSRSPRPEIATTHTHFPAGSIRLRPHEALSNLNGGLIWISLGAEALRIAPTSAPPPNAQTP